MGSRLHGCLAAFAIAVLATSAARADPTAADRETARSLMQEGRDLRDKGDLKEALKRFKAADQIMHVPTTGLEVARTQVSLGLLVEARDTLAAIRQYPAKRSDPAPFAEARTKADDLDASLNGRVPALTIVVKGAAEGEQATVAIDGVPLPSDVVGLPRSVDPGHHVATAKTPTGEGKAEVDVREGEQKSLEIALTAVTPAETTAPPAPEPETPEAPETPARSHAPGALTWTAIGVTGAGVIVGTVAGVLSLSKKSMLDAECPNQVCGPGTGYSTLDSANTLATISDVAFAAAGAGAVVAVVSLVLGHDATVAAPPQSQPAAILPWLGPGMAGVRGAF